jgi:hypothetical protein
MLQRKFVLGAVGLANQPPIADAMTVNRAANFLDGKRLQRRRRQHDFPQKEFLLFEKNHKTSFAGLPFFNTAEGRTLARAAASIPKIIFLIFIFFQTDDRHPAVAARLT